MWSVERPHLALRPYRAEARQLLLVLRADAVEAGWWAPSGWQTAQVLVLTGAGADGVSQEVPRNAADPSTAVRQMQALLADTSCGLGGRPGRRLTVLVAPPWLDEVVLPWSDALLREASVVPQARAELADRGHGWAPDAVLRIDHRPPLGQPRSALRVPAGLLPSLQALAREIGAQLVSVQSLTAVAACWAARQPVRGAAGAPALVGVMGAAGLRLVGRDGTAALAGQALLEAVPAGAADDLGASAARLWQRARLRFPALQAVAVLPVLALDAPPPTPPVALRLTDDATGAAGAAGGATGGATVAATVVAADRTSGSAASALVWVPWPRHGDGAGVPASRPALNRALLRQALRRATLDALPSRPGPAPAWQAAAALCLLAAAGLAGWSWQTRADLRAAAAAHTAPAPSANEAPLTRPALAELRAVNAAIGQLNLPLARLLRTLQPPRDIAVSLLGLDLTGRAADVEAPAGAAPAVPADKLGTAASLKLSVEAASAPDMTRYLAFLAGRDGISAVQLVRHEIDNPQASRPYRFTLDVAWQH